MTPDSPEASLSVRRLVRALLIALVIGFSLGIILLFGIRALRTPHQDQLSGIDTTPALRGTADHWKRIPNIGNLIDIQTLSDGSTWAVFGGDAVGRLDNNQWTQMPDQVTGDSLVALPGASPGASSALLVTGQTRTAWRTADRGTSWQPIDLGDAFATLKTSLWPLTSTAGQLWLASDTALAQDVHDNWTSVAAPPDMSIVQSHSMLAAHDGSVWTTLSSTAPNSATPTAQKPILWHYSPSAGWQVTTITPRPDVPILEDAQGGLWVALDSGGSAHFDGKAWQTFTLATMDGAGSRPSVSTADDSLDSGVIDHDGAVWWADTNGSIYRFDGQSWHSYTSADTDFAFLRGGSSLITDQGGYVWVAGALLARYADSQWQRFDPINSPIFEKMPKVYTAFARSLAKDGSLWFSVSAAGTVRYDGKTWTWFGPENNALLMPSTASSSDSYVPLASAADGSFILYKETDRAAYRYTP